jgi:hypothetical protein
MPSYCEAIPVINHRRQVSPHTHLNTSGQQDIVVNLRVWLSPTVQQQIIDTFIEFVEAMVHAVLQTDGVVEMVAADDHLTAYDGVEALLR